MSVKTKILRKRMDLEIFLFWSKAKPKRTRGFKGGVRQRAHAEIPLARKKYQQSLCTYVSLEFLLGG